jgi:hypothetical protein
MDNVCRVSGLVRGDDARSKGLRGLRSRVMRRGYLQAEETDDPTAGLLAVCALVCGFLVFGFYKPMQPEPTGPAAYKAPLASLPVVRFANGGSAAPRSRDAPDETTGAIQKVEPAVALKRAPAKQHPGAYVATNPGYAAPY